MKLEDCSVLILAGGNSSRMGTDKALLSCGNGQTLFRRIFEQIRKHFNEVIAVVRDRGSYTNYDDLVVLEDLPEVKGRGPLAGIYTGLKKTSKQHAFVIACDMPFVSETFVKKLIREYPESCDAFLPKRDGFIEPLCGVYSKLIIPKISKMFKSGINRAQDVVRFADVQFTSDECFNDNTNIFFNINYPSDIEELFNESKRC